MAEVINRLLSCIKIVPTPKLEASASTTKCLVKSAKAKTGVVHIATFKQANDFCAFSDQWNISLISKLMVLANVP